MITMPGSSGSTSSICSSCTSRSRASSTAPPSLPGVGEVARRRQGARDRGQQLHARPSGTTAGRDLGGAGRQPARGASVLPPTRPAGLDDEHGIINQAWSPIGGTTFYRDGKHGSTLRDPVIGEIAVAHGRTPAQVMLRWHLQQGRQAIPKSVTPSRIVENLDVFDFDLTVDQLAAIDALDTGVRGGPEPAQITRESFGFEIPEP